MKNSLSLLLLFSITALLAPKAEAQPKIVNPVEKTISAADTIEFKMVPSNIKSFSYAYTETSGTTAGKVYLEGSNITGAWDLIDSLTLADVSTIQKKTVPITATTYASYRWRNTNTSSATGTVKSVALRREDE